MKASERALIGEVALLAAMGPFGVMRLWRRRQTEHLRLLGASASWVAIGWTMSLAGVVFPDSLLELFFVGVFMYGAMTCFSRRKEVDKMGVPAVMLLAFLYTASAYFKVYVLRTSVELQALDLAIVVVGYLGFLLACWPAFKEES